MSTPVYSIGTGYFEQPGRGQDWFWHLWHRNTIRYAKPEQIFVTASGPAFPELLDEERRHTEWCRLHGNLGYCGQLLNGTKPHRFCGCLAGMLHLAMTAYCNETDFIYKEQDCLAYGPWVDRMYKEIGSHGAIFGRSFLMGAALSLILVKHDFIPDFVRLYLGTPAENKPEHIPETKFLNLLTEHPDLYTTYSFGVDRDRPLPITTEVWYAQKFTPEELIAIEAANLDQVGVIPQTCWKTFSNA